MSSSGNRRATDVRKLMTDYKVELIGDGMEELDVEFHGPEDSLYEGGQWKVKVFISDDYPNVSPSFLFINKIYHPNVEEKSGLICMNVIGQGWSPMFDLLDVFQVYLPQLLLDPNPSDPFNLDAAALMMSNLPAYELRVKEYCEKYAKPEDEAVSSEEKTTDEEPSEARAHSSDETVVAKPDL